MAFWTKGLAGHPVYSIQLIKSNLNPKLKNATQIKSQENHSNLNFKIYINNVFCKKFFKNEQIIVG